MKHYFFKNDSDDIRVVLQISSASFLVIKLIKNGPSTLKVWHGTTLAKTSQYWSTKPFEPTPEEEFQIVARFNRALASFRRELAIVLKWADRAHDAELKLSKILASKEGG